MKRKAEARDFGYRSLTKGELRSLGFSAGSRRYTSAAPGNATRASSFSRRSIEQRVTGTTFERGANLRAIETHGRSRLTLSISGEQLEGAASRYDWYLRAWAESHGQTIGQARRDPDRVANYHNLNEARRAKNKSRANAPGGKYAKALEAVGLRDPSSDKKVGDS